MAHRRFHGLTDPTALGAVARVCTRLGPQDERRIEGMLGLAQGGFPWPPLARVPRLTRTEQRELAALREAVVLDAEQCRRKVALESQAEMVGSPRVDLVLVAYCRYADVVQGDGGMPC